MVFMWNNFYCSQEMMQMEFENYYDLIHSGGINVIEKEKKDDLFVTCLSSEDRALAITEALSDDYKCRLAYILITEDKIVQNSSSSFIKNYEIVSNKLKRHSENIEIIDLSILNEVEQINKLREIFVICFDLELEKVSLSIDVSTFPRDLLMIITSLIRGRFLHSLIRVMYTSPKEHGEWLSRGVSTIRSVMGFSGYSSPSLPTLLVVLSGFEEERTLNIIEAHEPTKILLGIGDPAISSSFFHRNCDEQKLALSRSEVENFNFPTNNIISCVKILEGILNPFYRTHNIVVAPMNTKLSTLAALIIAERHQEIQITYAVPKEYNITNYSSGIGNIFIEILPQLIRGDI